MGKPVLIGPHTHNFEDASRLAVEGGAALRVADAKELGDKLGEIFATPGRLEAMGRAGMSYVRENQGATDRAIHIIGSFVNPLKHDKGC